MHAITPQNGQPELLAVAHQFSPRLAVFLRRNQFAPGLGFNLRVSSTRLSALPPGRLPRNCGSAAHGVIVITMHAQGNCIWLFSCCGLAYIINTMHTVACNEEPMTTTLLAAGTRMPIDDERKDVPFQIRSSRSWLDLLEFAAKEKGVSSAAFIRWVVNEHLAANGVIERFEEHRKKQKKPK